MQQALKLNVTCLLSEGHREYICESILAEWEEGPPSEQEQVHEMLHDLILSMAPESGTEWTSEDVADVCSCLWRWGQNGPGSGASVVRGDGKGRGFERRRVTASGRRVTATRREATCHTNLRPITGRSSSRWLCPPPSCLSSPAPACAQLGCARQIS